MTFLRSSWAPVVILPKKMDSETLPPSIMHIRSSNYAEKKKKIYVDTETGHKYDKNDNSWTQNIMALSSNKICITVFEK